LKNKIKSKTFVIDVEGYPQFFCKPVEDWEMTDLEAIANSIVTRIVYNPIVSVSVIRYDHSPPFAPIWFKVEYISKNSTATRYSNIAKIKEQLIMECF
jgi:hypothetical protein